MKISVVIPVYNGENTISRCLDSILKVDYPKENLEIIVVNNNSTDRTLSILQSYPVRIVFESIRNRARARNAGIQATSGEFIAMTDADCIVPSNWLKALLSKFTDQSVAAVAGPFCAIHNNSLMQQYNDYAFNRFRETMHRSTFPFLAGPNVMFRKTVFEQIGPFDPAFFTAEDSEIGYRIFLAGLSMQWTEQAMVLHNYRESLWQNLKTWYNYGYCAALLRSKVSPALFYRPILKDDIIQPLYYAVMVIPHTLLHIARKREESPISFLILDHMLLLSFMAGFWISLYALCFNPRKVSKQPTVQKCLLKEQEDQSFLFNPHKKSFFQLNESATFIWKLLSEKKSEIEIAQNLASYYGIDKNEALEDTRHVISFLKEHNIPIS